MDYEQEYKEALERAMSTYGVPPKLKEVAIKSKNRN